MKTIYLLLLIAIPSLVSSQVNIDSIGNLNYFDLHQTSLNDVWGYVDENNNEYALVGAGNGTSVVDLTDPSNPTEIFWEPGSNTIWRDLKTFGDYAYVTTEASNGLLIIDLSPLPASTALPTNYYFGPTGDEWQTAHNLYVDSAGYAYIFGANRGNGGVIILDIATDPMNPIEIGVFDNWYAHDGYVLGDTMYLAHISDGFISIVDISDRANPVLLGTKSTPSNYAHNIWTSADGQFAYTTDELEFSYVASYDISDPTNIVELDRIQSTPGSGSVPHNAHVFGDFLVTSHYTDGIVIHDITHPYNLVEVGDYDTHPILNFGTNGCWGAYPYLPSGLILATDMAFGLFVLEPTYTKAAYLEGTITDANTLNPINLVDVEIIGGTHSESSNSSGFYAAGMLDEGMYDVTFSKVGYFPQTVSVDLTTGVITNQDISLVPIPPYSFTLKVRESGTNDAIIGADIQLEGTNLSLLEQTNGLGERVFSLYYEEVVSIIVGKWGYVTHCIEPFLDQSTGEITIFLEPGYYDDFTFDFGWSSNSTATSGDWERGVPNGVSPGNSAPDFDAQFDCGNRAYVTGNAPNVNQNGDDVDEGEVTLISPVMDLTSFTDPQVNYARWFFNQFGVNPPDDSLEITVSNGTTTALIEIIGTDIPNHGTWQYAQHRLLDYIPITSTMQFFFKTSDMPDPINHITEAGLDQFFINEYVVGLDELSKAEIQAFPNPTNASVQLTNIEAELEYTVMNTNGQVILEGVVSPNQREIALNQVDSGIYFVHISNQIVKIFKTN